MTSVERKTLLAKLRQLEAKFEFEIMLLDDQHNTCELIDDEIKALKKRLKINSTK